MNKRKCVYRIRMTQLTWDQWQMIILCHICFQTRSHMTEKWPWHTNAKVFTVNLTLQDKSWTRHMAIWWSFVSNYFKTPFYLSKLFVPHANTRRAHCDLNHWTCSMILKSDTSSCDNDHLCQIYFIRTWPCLTMLLAWHENARKVYWDLDLRNFSMIPERDASSCDDDHLCLITAISHQAWQSNGLDTKMPKVGTVTLNLQKKNL